MIKIKEITKRNKNYPKQLLQIKNPPEKLYVEGNYELLNNNSIAIVGSRKASEYGKRSAAMFAKEISKAGITIVSGMAIGIDGVAHINSMEQAGKTIAVLGSGLKQIYPTENEYLYNKILENGGCVISEYEPNIPATSANFPRRNRIISGLAMGVLIVEARYRSGSTITAKFAIEQKKEVFCIPNKLDAKAGYSTNLLIKNGAILVTEPSDIINLYNLEEEKSKNIEILDEKYKCIYEKIGDLPITANDLSNLCKMPIEKILEGICILEIEGLIKPIGGNKFARVE